MLRNKKMENGQKTPATAQALLGHPSSVGAAPSAEREVGEVDGSSNTSGWTMRGGESAVELGHEEVEVAGMLADVVVLANGAMLVVAVVVDAAKSFFRKNSKL